MFYKLGVSLVFIIESEFLRIPMIDFHNTFSSLLAREGRTAQA